MNLIDFLFDEYQKQLPEGADRGPADAFAAWAKKYLSDVNPPAGTTYPGLGIGLVLRQGHRVVFEAQSAGEMRVDPASAMLRQNWFTPGDLMPDTSVPITGGSLAKN